MRLGRRRRGAHTTDRAPLHRPTLQERFEATRFGRTTISVLVVLVIAAIVFSNVTGEKPRVRNAVVYTALRASGLRQFWSMFAPNPSRVTTRVVAVVRFSDGTRETWTPPKGSPILGSYHDYRWRKLTWFSKDTPLRDSLVRAISGWLARQHLRDAARPPVEVIFYRAAALTPPPGSDRRAVGRLSVLGRMTVDPTRGGAR